MGRGHAATNFWSNANGGYWSSPTNWSLGQVPASGDTVVIAAAGVYTVVMDTSATLAGLTLGAGGGQQTLSLNGGLVDLELDGPSDVGASGVLALSKLAISGTGPLTVNGTFNWSAGSIGGSIHPFTIMITANGLLNLSGDTTKFFAGVLTNAGQLVWRGLGDLNIDGSIYNLQGGIIDVQDDQHFTYGGGDGWEINNAGLFQKSGGTRTNNLVPNAVPFSNTGTLDVQSGGVQFNYPVTGTGIFYAAPGAALLFANGGSFGDGTQFTGAGDDVWTGGNMTLDGNVYAQSVWVTAGAWLRGSNWLSGTWNWSGGSLGLSDSQTTVANNGLLNVLGAQSQGIGGVLLNAGKITCSGTNTLGLGRFYNLASGTLELQSDRSLGGSIINNAGWIRKTAGYGTNSIPSTFTNTGLVEVGTGALSIAGGTNLGTLMVDLGATLLFPSGFGFGPGALTGLGTVLWTGGGVNINGTVDAASVQLAGATLSGTNAFSGTFIWSSGQFGTSGSQTTILTNAAFHITGASNKLQCATLLNAGTVVWDGTGDLSLAGGQIWNLPGATFDIRNDQNLNFSSGGVLSPLINNRGLFRKAAGSGTNAIGKLNGGFGVPLTNTATVDVESGTLQLWGGGFNSATFNAAPGATLGLAGSYTLGAGSLLTGGGTNLWSAGTVTVNGVVTCQNLWLGGALLSGTNTFAGGFNWSSGTVGNNAAVSIPSDSVVSLTGGASKTLAGVLTNWGTVSVPGSGIVFMGMFYNQAGATLDLESDAALSGGLIQNAGLLRKSGGTGTNSLSGSLLNTGTVDAGTGTLSPAGGSSTGVFNAAAGATIMVAGDYSFGSGIQFTGAGTNLWLGTPPRNIHTVAVNGAASSQNVVLAGAILAGTNQFSGTWSWNSGFLDSAAAVSLANNCVLNIAGSATKNWGGVLSNAGTINWTGTGNLTLSGALENLAGGTFEVQNDQSISGGVIRNEGLFRKSAGTGTNLLSSVAFTNTGILAVQTGTLGLGANCSLNGGTLSLALSNSTNFGSVTVAGLANLGGGLSVPSSNGFSPALGSQWQLLSCSNRVGTFSPVTVPGGFTLSYSNNGVYLLASGQAPPQLLSPTLSGGNLQFGWQSVLNQSYTIELRNALSSGAWTFYTNITGNGALLQVSIPANLPQAYIRVREP